MECSACDRPPASRWKAPLLFIGTLFLCPCHLPVTFGILAAAGAGLAGVPWLLSHKPVVYGVMSLAYLFMLFFFLRWAMRSRDAELVHERHATEQ